MPTIKDVARRAGVAISTASAAINRSAPVSDVVLAKVADAIREIGYVPHAGARSMRSGRSKLIGLVVPNIANPWCGAIAREVENVCLKAGYTAVVYSSGQNARRESEVLAMMRQQRVDGMVIVPSRSDRRHGEALLDQIGVPAVLLDMSVDGLPFDVVKADNVEAGRLATAHLLGLGHRSIGIIVGIPGLATSDDRLAGYRAAHDLMGVPVHPQLIVPGQFDQAIAHARAVELLRLPLAPTAIVTISNMMTMGLLFALRDLGLRAPHDLSYVGIDDLDFSALLEPAATTVSTPILEMSRRAIELLLEQLTGAAREAANTEIYPPALHLGGSSAPPASKSFSP